MTTWGHNYIGADPVAFGTSDTRADAPAHASALSLANALAN